MGSGDQSPLSIGEQHRQAPATITLNSIDRRSRIGNSSVKAVAWQADLSAMNLR
jgi:hypothetical protein